MKHFYRIVGLPHILCYAYFHKRIEEIDLDLSRYTGGTIGVKSFYNVLPQKEYRYIFYYRIPFLIRHVLNAILPRTTNCYLHTANVLGGVKIVHGFSSIIVAERIGRNFEFYQNVTVGWGKGGIPTIGNNVKLHTGAVVFGGITIGDNVRVAANTVVRTDIPDNSLVYGNPAVIVRESQ